MMKLAVFVFLACVLNVYAKQSKFDVGTKACNVADFKIAQKNFATKLGLPVEDDWNKPLDLFKAVQASFGDDTRVGLVYACNAFNTLIDELNKKDINAKTCFDPLFLLANDDTPDDAIHFSGLVGALRFQCGAGFYPIVQNDNWKCASGAFKKYSDVMFDQLKNVLADADQHPSGRCTVVKNGEVGYYKPVHDACASPEITYFACQTFNQFFNTMYGECQNECKLIA